MPRMFHVAMRAYILCICWHVGCIAGLAQVFWPGCCSIYASAFIPMLLYILHAASASSLLYVAKLVSSLQVEAQGATSGT